MQAVTKICCTIVGVAYPTRLPVGGLKEKTLAARRAGIRQVIVPKRNEKDLADIPEEVRKALKWHFVSNIDEVMAVAFGAAKKAAKVNKPRPVLN